MRGASIDHGFDAGKKIKGKKRHVLVVTQGLLMQAIVHSADVQDRDGGVLLLATLLGRFPYLEKLFADSAYRGPIFAEAVAKILSRVKIEIVKRSDQSGKRLRDAAQALDRRANDRLAQPLPKTGQGLGEPQLHSPRVPSLRLRPSHVAKALQSRMNFRVRLSRTMGFWYRGARLHLPTSNTTLDGVRKGRMMPSCLAVSSSAA